MMLFFLLLACASDAQKHPKLEDRDNYDRAMQHSGASAISFCAKIRSEDLRGECVLFAAKQEAHQRRDSRKLCSQAPTQAWKEACRFDVIDILGMTGTRADEACQQTGDFQGRCMYHALLREEEQLAARFPAGSETELLQAIQERMGQLAVEEADEEPLQVVLTARIVARRFEANWRKNPVLTFSKDDCGKAPETVCSEAYRIAIKQIGKGRRPSNCALPMTRERVVQVGLPVWSDSFASLAQRAWKSLCHVNRGPSKSPDHSSSQRKKP